MEAQLTIETIRQAKEILDSAECESAMMPMVCPHCWNGSIYELHIFDEHTGDFCVHIHVYDCPICRGWPSLIRRLLKNDQSQNKKG